MINHFVLFKFKSGTSAKHIDEFCTRMLELRQRIPEIRKLEIGADILQEKRSWDLLLMMQFSSIDALRRYQMHPAHTEVAEFNNPHLADVAAIDYEASQS